ncbi:alpha/beta hydrolase fold protein [Streptomyces griseus]|uniref:Alpha/beta hydrolase fold protein n=2 Tax=Streptomyces TaxID=1883 RepID=A0A380N8K4_STRGR|nr:alpha/beta hydrolase fold protein [Streptomyces griseus]
MAGGPSSTVLATDLIRASYGAETEILTASSGGDPVAVPTGRTPAATSHRRTGERGTGLSHPISPGGERGEGVTMVAMDYGVTDPARLGQTRMPDGRLLGWAEWGPADGTPVLLCPGAATSRWLGFGGGVVDSAGARLISVDRPGLGASDPDPGRTLSSWAADIGQLVQERALHAPAAVGFSQGAPFALALAAGGLVDAVAVVSGSDELAHPRFARSLAPRVREMVAAVAADSLGAEEAFAGHGGPEALWELIVTTSAEADLRVYTDPVFRPAFRRASQEAFSRGPAGYARDTALAMGRWPFDPAGIAVPVDLWYGQRDTSPVHSPDLGASLARMIPGATRHVLPTAGGSLLWTHGGTVLRTVLGHVR